MARIVFARWWEKAGDFSNPIGVPRCRDRMLSLRYQNVPVFVYPGGYMRGHRCRKLLKRLGMILDLQGTVAMAQKATRLMRGDVVVYMSDDGRLGLIELNTEYIRKEMIWALG